MSETSGIDLVTRSFVSLCIFLVQDWDQDQDCYEDQNIYLVKILYLSIKGSSITHIKLFEFAKLQ